MYKSMKAPLHDPILAEFADALSQVSAISKENTAPMCSHFAHRETLGKTRDRVFKSSSDSTLFDEQRFPQLKLELSRLLGRSPPGSGAGVSVNR